MRSFYHGSEDALSFVTALLIKSLPILHLSLGLLLAAFTLAFLMRLILTWYPEVKITEGLWIFLVVPTEPFLKFTRSFIKPIGGVDVTPVVWIGLMSLCRELLVGQQGILSQILRNIQTFQ
tara:strand:- start:657 stop:1019 length:363 start_codon:yes stop_codon:yes gene_type:complete